MVGFLGRKIYSLSLKSTNGLFCDLQDSTSGKKKLSTYAAGRGDPPNILSPVPIKKVGNLKRQSYT